MVKPPRRLVEAENDLGFVRHGDSSLRRTVNVTINLSRGASKAWPCLTLKAAKCKAAETPESSSRIGSPEHVRYPKIHGRPHPCADDGRGAQGQVRPPGHAAGHGRRGNGALDPVPEIRRLPAAVAGPRPLRAV